MHLYATAMPAVSRANDCCDAPNEVVAHCAGASTEQVGHVDDALCHVGEPQALVHRGLAQPLVSLVLADPVALHQEALRALDDLALGQLAARVGQLAAHRLLMLE